MALFNFGKKKKPYVITTTLRGVTAKGRQELLSQLLADHADLRVEWLLTSGTLGFAVTYKYKTIGIIDSKISRSIEEQYTVRGGLSCSLEIGQNYKISKDADGKLSCTVDLKVIPE